MTKKIESAEQKQEMDRRDLLRVSTKALAASLLVGVWNSTGLADRYRQQQRHHPSPKPKPTPKPSPSPSPVASPSPAPSVSPSPSPSVSPSPVASASPSPTASASPSPPPSSSTSLSSTSPTSINSALCTPSISVKSYGATGNGTTDDTTAIQNANNAAASAGVAVFFPAGTYAVSKTLVQTASWMGPDAGTVYNADNPVKLLKTNGNTNGSAIVQVSASNISCRYISCTVPNPPTYDMSIYPTGSDYAKNPSYGFYVADTTTVQGISFYGCSSTGFVIAGFYLGAKATGQIELCDARWGAVGISIAGPNCVVIDCTLHHNCGQGLLITGASTQVINNRIEWNAAEGIMITGGTHFLVNSTLFDRNGKAGISIANGSGGSVLGNYFSRNGASGDGTSGRWGFSTPGAESYVLIAPADSCQIKVSHQTTLTISGNRYRAGTSDADDGTFSPGYIYNNAGSNAGITVTNNAGEEAAAGGCGGYNSSYAGGSGEYAGGSF